VEQGKQAVESLRPMLTPAEPRQFTKIMAEVFRKIDGQYAAKTAIDIGDPQQHSACSARLNATLNRRPGGGLENGGLRDELVARCRRPDRYR
jgi:hypothetical protein